MAERIKESTPAPPPPIPKPTPATNPVPTSHGKEADFGDGELLTKIETGRSDPETKKPANSQPSEARGEPTPINAQPSTAPNGCAVGCLVLVLLPVLFMIIASMRGCNEATTNTTPPVAQQDRPALQLNPNPPAPNIDPPVSATSRPTPYVIQTGNVTSQSANLPLSQPPKSQIASPPHSPSPKDFIWKGTNYGVPRAKWPALNAKRRLVYQKVDTIEKLIGNLNATSSFSKSHLSKNEQALMRELRKTQAERDRMVSEIDKTLSTIAQ